MNSTQPIDIRDILCEMGCEESVVFDNPDFDSAIIGITEDDRMWLCTRYAEKDD